MIAKETARTLGLGVNIQDAAGLPNLDADGKVPKDLGKRYGKMILEADGFAQVGCLVASQQSVQLVLLCVNQGLKMLGLYCWFSYREQHSLVAIHQFTKLLLLF